MTLPPLSALPEAESAAAFASHLKPRLARLLHAIGLDVVYTRAEGDSLYVRDADGGEREVLDMLGGFGACLFGHNHPELVRRATEVLATGRPFLAQGSVRPYAGLLAQRLSEMVGRTTGATYAVTLANSGTEAVEAAIKHAEYERTTRAGRILAGQARTFRRIRVALRSGGVAPLDGVLEGAARLFDVTEIRDVDALEQHLLQFNRAVLEAPGRFLAIEGAFHGKTTGALKLTHNADFRTPWRRLGIDGEFIAPDAAALRAATTAADDSYYEPVLGESGEVALVARPWSRIAACLVEPIQGEGGIHELPAAFLQALRAEADRTGFALVIDEIQSGMGRTGEFLASAASGVRGDYYLFSKSLGGGLAKVSALLVQRDRYVEEFGMLHTSTFAEDDFSCAIALGALDLLEADDGALMRACREKGDYLLGQLRAVQRRYPQALKAVRGRGLLIGVELAPQTRSASALLRVASEQHLLGFLASGYLLHEAGVRVTPTLSANNTIRLEPSAYVSFAALDRVARAFERLAEILARGDTHRFVRYMALGADDDATRPEPRADASPAPARAEPPATATHKVACIAHFIEPEDLLHWDPTLAPLSAAQCSRLLERTEAILEPFVSAERIVRSPLGGSVALTVVALATTAARLMARMRGGEGPAVLAEIEAAVDVARRRGCTQVGFAGYTSIATNNCLDLDEDAIGLTSGNSLTAAAALEATRGAARELGIELPTARLGVIGAIGNIGRVLAEIEADEVASVVLVGRPGTQKRLERFAESLYARAWQQVRDGGALSGIARAVGSSAVARRLDGISAGADAGAALRQAFDAVPDAAPIRVTTELEALRECNLVISATNAPEPIILPEHIGSTPTVICDVSVPADVHADALGARPSARVIKGGVIGLPRGETLGINGMALRDGEAYACLTEVLLLGLAGVREHFSRGPLEAERVRQIRHLASEHGFSVLIKDDPRAAPGTPGATGRVAAGA
jgi:acetylornithine/succinyldiaminopimelate/putrescine aminotransferase/predicted amino acid dehydrogenase